MDIAFSECNFECEFCKGNLTSFKSVHSMNSRVFKTVFSKRLGMLVAVGENVSGQTKGKGGVRLAHGISKELFSFLGLLALAFGLTNWAWVLIHFEN
ncbi:MAG: Extended Signal Peptide of Type secretion system [Pseudomonadota bacterium]|jgi:hypothetical protein